MKRDLNADYLLFCLSEEAGEIIQVASKIYRFGQNDTAPGSSTYNKTHLAKEIGDLLGIVDMLREHGVDIDDEIVQMYRIGKRGRIAAYIEREVRQ